MAQTKPKAAQFYGVSGNGTAGQVLISDGNGGMSWGANTEEFTVSWNTPTGQSLTYTQPSPQSSIGTAGSAFPSTTFTVTKSDSILSGTATIAGLPTGIAASQSYNNTSIGNILTVTLTGTFPGADSLNTDLTLSGLLITKTVSWATPTGQSLTYTQPSPQSSTENPGTAFPTTTFTATPPSGEEISGTATIVGLPTGITATQSLSGTGVNNVLTVTLAGVFPSADSLNTALTLSGLTVAAPLTVDYLVVAGGGSSGAAGGGAGGGGGLRTSYGSTTGGGGSSESTLTLVASTNYSVTVGAGGAGVVHPNAGNPGSNSVFSTITSTGGGFGGAYNAGYGGGTGGSGGGAGNSAASGTSAGAVVSPTQGYVGGYKSVGSGAPNYVSAGGGGAGGAAGNVTQNTTPSDGGVGLAVNILNSTNAATASVGEVSGSNVYYAGGGGGASGTAGQPFGAGGLGGGTDGAAGCPGTAPLAGVANTGGGNGGTGGCPSAYSTGGGSGVVILRYPSSYTVSGLTEATGSPFTEGASKVSVFTTSGTGNIQFN